MNNISRVIVGLLSGIFVISILIIFVGIEKFIETLFSADPVLTTISILFALLWLSLWSLTFYIVINYSGTSMNYIKSFLTYSTVMFAHNITPFAHFGGEPVAAEFVSKSTDDKYEKCLGALSSVSVIHFIPSVFYFSIGGSYILITENGIPEPMQLLLSGFLLVAISVIAAYIAFRIYGQVFIDKILQLLLFISHLLEKIPYIPSIEDEKIESSVRGYFDTLLYVTSNRKIVLFAVSASIAGVLCQSIGLWIATYAVGSPVSIIYPIVAFPISRIASALPSPGGAGGIEAGLITIIVTLSNSGIPEISAAVILMRGAIYWLPVSIGSINLGLIATKN